MKHHFRILSLLDSDVGPSFAQLRIVWYSLELFFRCVGIYFAFRRLWIAISAYFYHRYK